MLVAALLGAGTEIVIPLLTKAAIDGPIAASAQTLGHGYGLLIPIGLAAIGLGVAEVAMNVLRRWVQATAVAGWSSRCAIRSISTCSGWSLRFHDQWQSGQLLSRATTDLSAIRRFFSFGIVFMITSSASFVVIVILLIRLNLLLGLLTAAVFAPVTALCLWFERRYSVLSRRVQDQQDDLATCVEEAAAGIRVHQGPRAARALGWPPPQAGDDRLRDPGPQGAAARCVLGQPRPGAERRDRADLADRRAGRRPAIA